MTDEPRGVKCVSHLQVLEGRSQHPLSRGLQRLGAVLLLCLEDFLVVLFPASLVPVAQETEPMSPCLEIPLNRTGKETRKILIRGDDPGAIRVLCSGPCSSHSPVCLSDVYRAFISFALRR